MLVRNEIFPSSDYKFIVDTCNQSQRRACLKKNERVIVDDRSIYCVNISSMYLAKNDTYTRPSAIRTIVQ